jgi:DNA-binding transcriptional LysR family regulator
VPGLLDWGGQKNRWSRIQVPQPAPPINSAADVLAVRGTLSSNSVETIRAGILAGVGIGLFAKVSLADELRHPDVITVLDEFIGDARDVSLIWPKRRHVPARVRRATDFFAAAIPQRI